MSLVCSGWWADREKTRRVHDEVRMLRNDGDNDQPPSHGVCLECRTVFIANLPAKPLAMASRRLKKKGRRRR